MEIKTVCKKVSAEGTAVFDQEVNELLADGWRLSKRDLIPGYDLGDGVYFVPSHYAELVKLDEDVMETKEPDPPFGWDECVEIIREECKAAPGCDERCAVYAWCQKNIPETTPAPKYWSDPT